MNNIFYKTFSLKRFIVLASLITIAFTSLFFIGIKKLAAPTFSQFNNHSPLIIIDAGHGGEDGGTQSAEGVLEKDVNLSISKKVNSVFQSHGFKTLMVRDEDKLIYEPGCSTQREKKVSDIHKRMELMKNNPNSIFLSIHQNYYKDSKYSGAQVFYSKNISKSELIASSVQKSIRENLQPDNNREIKPSGTGIFLLYNAVVPAVMVECGFMSNPREAEKLCDEAYQEEMAVAIVNGIIDYLRTAN